MKHAALFLAGVVALHTFSANACTTFVMQGGQRVYFGRNLDWDWDQGMIVINPRGLQKRAFVASTNAVAWTSKYGSVTFNQFGRELPFGGMNETGLVIEDMWLTETLYPPSDSRPEINMLQWIQYQLDTCRTVSEVVDSDKHVRLENTPVRARIHYLVCDAGGDCATIEFLNGEMHVHRGKDLPFHALANDPYDRAQKTMRESDASRDLSKPLSNTDSLPRFCQAAARAAAFKPGTNSDADIAYAFETLDQVRQGNYTAWQMVYDVTGRTIKFRTRSNPKIRSISLKALDFSCDHPVQFADIQSNPAEEGKLPFRDLTEAQHREYLHHFVAQKNLKETVGDIEPMLEPLLMTLHGYTCAGK